MGKIRGEKMLALELQKIYFHQGKFLIKDINLKVEENETVAIVGKSGAGKSTLIGLISGANKPNAGIIRYFGQEMYENEQEILGRMSVSFDTPNFNTAMKAKNLVKEIKKFEPFFNIEKFEEYADRMELNISQKVRFYSSGMKKKIMLALALSREPELLVFDEPFSGVDDNSKEEMQNLIREYRKEKKLTVLVTAHSKSEAEKYCDKVFTIENGELI